MGSPFGIVPKYDGEDEPVNTEAKDEGVLSSGLEAGDEKGSAKGIKGTRLANAGRRLAFKSREAEALKFAAASFERGAGFAFAVND